MSELLDALRFPLHGSRLIEASAGTGKTWTIAALYLRLVLGHGGDDAFGRPLIPSEILVMTFTRAATRELSNRVRERLIEAAAFFRGELESQDPLLAQLAGACHSDAERRMAAHRLQGGAETMDEAAIFTIDAWCQRMLREHAFDSGSLFDEELISDERALLEDAAHDYWRQNVYPLDAAELRVLLACWADVSTLKRKVRELVPRAATFGEVPEESLARLIARVAEEQKAILAPLKEGWHARADAMERWIVQQREANPDCFHKSWMAPQAVAEWLAALRTWALDETLHMPGLNDAAWGRLTPEGIAKAMKKGLNLEIPDCFDFTTALRLALQDVDPIDHALHRHAACSIARRMAQLKKKGRLFGFADMLQRLKAALEGANGDALRQRITGQYPVAMVDEFQDTSPDQYRIFDLLYRVADNDRAHGLFLIGDPKQSIYGFRGADIHSYLDARRATAGRHYQLGTNYRATAALVHAVNHLFLHAEGDGERPGFAGGAFRFRRDDDNPLPFEPVQAKGRAEALVGADGPCQAMAVCLSERADLKADDYRDFFAHHCAEHIVGLLNDPRVGFQQGAAFKRLVPADIAILVRDRNEALAVRRALEQRQVPSVYLSDKDSVVDSVEAADVLRWLQAVANPLDGALARAAYATRTAALPLAELARLSSDELAWEERVEQLKALHVVWQRQGVLAMLRRMIHELDLPSSLLHQAGGERRLTNLLHLADILQAASGQLDGEQALIRWFAEQVNGEAEGGEERVLRLESDAELVKVVTVHKSKGLEYPLVYLPFAVTARKTERRNRSFFEYVGQDGKRRLDLSLSDQARQAVDRARLEEDLRLLYVALTRARHFLWLGVAALDTSASGASRLHESALGYLLVGDTAVGAADLGGHWERLRGDNDAIGVHVLPGPQGVTPLARSEHKPPLGDAARFDAPFERNWTVGSFTSLTRQTAAAPMRAQEETLLDEDLAQGAAGQSDDAPWHRFPRGSVPGNFLHEQLEWMGQEGFAIATEAQFEERLGLRCERAGWGHRKDDAIAWLRTIATTRLPLLGAALSQIVTVLPEMEFWFPSERLNVGALDALCSRRLLHGTARAALPERELHGMLKGFADLVFEHEGRFWVLDYKSNSLGGNDAAYGSGAMAVGMAAHRYDIQGAIYQLALHRLLRSRLGEAYDPARQLGGAIFMFLRGIANVNTRGCYLLEPDLALLDGLDALLGEEGA